MAKLCKHCLEPLPPESPPDKLFCNGTCNSAHAHKHEPRGPWGQFLRATLKGGMYRCPFCITTTRRQDSMSEHIRRHHRDQIPDVSDTCLFCDASLDIADIANGAKFCGDVCSNAYDHWGTQSAIDEKTKGIEYVMLIRRGLYYCPYPDCDEGFMRQSDLRSHALNEHAIQNLVKFIRRDFTSDQWGQVWDSEEHRMVMGWEPQFVDVALREMRK